MFKAAGTHKSGERYFIIGVSEDDISHMRHNGPIGLDGRDLGIPGKLIVFYGETETAMLDMFKEAGVPLGEQSQTER